MNLKVEEASDVEYQGVKHHYDPKDEWKRYELRKKFTSDEDEPKWRFNKLKNEEVIIVVKATGNDPKFKL